MVDLEAVAAIVGDAKVVGLGESLHAVTEYYELKDQVFRHLVEHHGFRVFAMEAGFAEGLLVDDWITRRTDLPLDDVLRRGFTYNMGCCEEFAAQLEWMRSWNDAHPDDPVHYSGTDLPGWLDSDERALDVAHRFLAGVEPEPPELVDADDLAAWLANREPVYARRSSRLAAASATRAAETAAALGRMKQRPEHVSAASTRDMTMAHTILWLLHVHGPGTRVVFGAHNGHLQRTPPWGGEDMCTAGRYLAHHLGTDYRPIGTTFGFANGFTDPMTDAIDADDLGVVPVGYGPAGPDTVDHVMRQRESNVIDLRVEPIDAPRMRIQPLTIAIDAAAAFDALIHIDELNLFHARSLDRPEG
jgi:erythromycin esterase